MYQNTNKCNKFIKYTSSNEYKINNVQKKNLNKQKKRLNKTDFFVYVLNQSL